MHPEHKRILTKLRAHAGAREILSGKDSYILSGHTYYQVPVPQRRVIAHTWLAERADISTTECIAVLDSLYHGKSHEEKTIASILLGYTPSVRKKVTFKMLDQWLGELVGWAEIDCLCQNNFTAEELLANWKQWEAFIRRLSNDANINKRRAALVFLVGPVTYSNDARLRDLAFAMINTLQHEKPIIITKAISWLLRSMVKNHSRLVREYLSKNQALLPKIALRETKRKIETRRK